MAQGVPAVSRTQVAEKPANEEELARAPQPRKAQNQAPSVPEMVIEMRDWLMVLERSVAAYNHLSLSLASYMGHLPEGERKKGLPVFGFKASLDGVKAVEVVADVAKIAKYMPDYVQHVMVPFINVQAVEMLEAVEEIETRVQILKPLLKSISSGGQEGAQDAP